MNTSARKILSLCALATSLVLVGCASTLQSEVTSFQRWPANVLGATYSFKHTAKQADSLEQAHYEDLARNELAKLGLSETPNVKGRFEVNLDYGINTKTVKSQEAVWDNQLHWIPPHFRQHHGWRPGYWAPSPYGPRVVGYRTISQDISTRKMRLEISEGAAKVFEASAVSTGTTNSLPAVMPYLVRSVFEGFPGANGQVRVVKYALDKNFAAQSVKP